MPTREQHPSVAALLASAPADGASVEVRGFLHAAPGRVVLCDALAESWPPQPGGQTVLVAGLDPASPAEMSSYGDDRWSPSPRTVRGVWEDGRIHSAEVDDATG